jgi:hypothetical protein
VDYVLWDWWEREWLLLLLRWVKKEMNVKTKVKMEIGVVVAAAVASSRRRRLTVVMMMMPNQHSSLSFLLLTPSLAVSFLLFIVPILFCFDQNILNTV